MNRIWRNATLFALAVTAAVFAYEYAFYGHLKGFVWLQIFAVSSVIVIAPSLALSGLAYFWNFADRFIIYRKSLGLLGFYLGLIHVGISIARSDIPFEAFTLGSTRDMFIIVGYGAVVLFALMPLFSSRMSLLRIGGHGVRLALRYLGYSAYALVLIHGAYLAYPSWMRWYDAGETLLLPPTMVAVIVGALVFVLRFALLIATCSKKRHSAPTE
jgi:DMSO/TMAO reductase YedYZ heme-binding membrane subunit